MSPGHNFIKCAGEKRMDQFLGWGMRSGTELGPEEEPLRGSWELVGVGGQVCACRLRREREQKIPGEGGGESGLLGSHS